MSFDTDIHPLGAEFEIYKIRILEKLLGISRKRDKGARNFLRQKSRNLKDSK